MPKRTAPLLQNSPPTNLNPLIDQSLICVYSVGSTLYFRQPHLASYLTRWTYFLRSSFDNMIASYTYAPTGIDFHASENQCASDKWCPYCLIELSIRTMLLATYHMTFCPCLT